MNARRFFSLWHDSRKTRRYFLNKNSDCRHIGISETAKILNSCPGCDIDGDMWYDGLGYRYFNLGIGVIEKDGTVYT